MGAVDPAEVLVDRQRAALSYRRSPAWSRSSAPVAGANPAIAALAGGFSLYMPQNTTDGWLRSRSIMRPRPRVAVIQHPRAFPDPGQVALRIDHHAQVVGEIQETGRAGCRWVRIRLNPASFARVISRTIISRLG